MTSMDKTRTRYGARIRKGNVYVVMAEDVEHGKKYIIKVFSNHPSACAFVEAEQSKPQNLPLSVEKWAIT